MATIKLINNEVLKMKNNNKQNPKFFYGTKSDFFSLINKTTDSYNFKNVSEAIKWAKNTNDKAWGNQLSNTIRMAHSLKTMIAKGVLHENYPNKPLVMIIDGSKKGVKIRVGTPSKLANESMR